MTIYKITDSCFVALNNGALWFHNLINALNYAEHNTSKADIDFKPSGNVLAHYKWILTEGWVTWQD